MGLSRLRLRGRAISEMNEGAVRRTAFEKLQKCPKICKKDNLGDILLLFVATLWE
jgi:hypothetical protein